jgi:hypothetical protein
MENVQNCSLGRACIVHRFDPRISERLVNRAFDLLIDAEFSIEDRQRFWLVIRGQR